MMTYKRATLLVVFSLASAAALADDDDSDRHDKGRDCGALSGRSLGGAMISAATVVPASAALAAHCKVIGLIAPQLNFEMRLPNHWNHKLHYGG